MVGVSGLDGGVRVCVIVTVAELGFPTEYPVPFETVTVREPSTLSLFSVVGMEMVSVAEAEKLIVLLKIDPLLPGP